MLNLTLISCRCRSHGSRVNRQPHPALWARARVSWWAAEAAGCASIVRPLVGKKRLVVRGRLIYRVLLRTTDDGMDTVLDEYDPR